jgi:methylated-DNA-[protein]-cysteine S-methyltransferase
MLEPMDPENPFASKLIAPLSTSRRLARDPAGGPSAGGECSRYAPSFVQQLGVQIDVGPLARVATALLTLQNGFLLRCITMREVQAVHFWRIESPVGPLLLAATDKGLRYLLFDRGQPAQSRPDEAWIESARALGDYEEQLRAYFRGQLRSFTCRLDLQGTSFQKKCWAALQEIPYGITCTYAELAKRVGSPRAFRAVGQANHNNPVAIIVPCHRVIGADGSLTGYGGGMEIKQKLLHLEGAAVQGTLTFAARTTTKG